MAPGGQYLEPLDLNNSIGLVFHMASGCYVVTIDFMDLRVIVTGHRPTRLPGGYDWDDERNIAIRDWMEERLKHYQKQGDLIAGTGMALGVDQFFAARCYHNHVPFIAFLPCHDQDKRWPAESRDLHRRLLSHAREERYTCDAPWPGPWCMTQRNQDMVDWASETPGGVLLSVWDEVEKGGTWDCIKRARSAELTVEFFDPTTWPF